MHRSILITVLLTGILLAFGCSGTPMVPQNNPDIDTFFNGVSPILTGVVGEYTYTGNDGTIETGKVVADESGLTFVPDRGSSVFANKWFNVNCEYLNPRTYSSGGLPIYYIGDTFTYKLHIKYNKRLPLDLYPHIYAEVTAEQRYWPSLLPLPGDWKHVWVPVEIPPLGSVVLTDTYTIPSSAVPGNDATVVNIDILFAFGKIHFNAARGVCGLWDP